MTDAPTLPRSTGFTRELTPTWLSTVALLAGQRPPDPTRSRRYVHLGCGTGETAAVVAANHPHTEVWGWDLHPEHQHGTAQLGGAAGLDNLVVHDRRELPNDLGGAAADVIVVQDVLAAADDALRTRIADAVRSSLRPGGLLCVTYPTLTGWVEIAPVQTLMRLVAQGHDGRPDVVVPEVLRTVQQLRAGGARYLNDRPVVAAWLEQLHALDPAEVTARYLRDPFRPLSPAQVAGLFATVGCERLGSARLTDELDADLAAELVAAVADAPTRELQETYRDLATRRSYRMDVFRLGGVEMGPAERDERIGGLNLAGTADAEEPLAVAVDRDAWRHLTTYGVAAGELHGDPARVPQIVRVLMDAGQVHPVVPNGPSRAALEGCEALNAVLAAAPADTPDADLRAIPLLGSAVRSGRSTAVRGIPASRGGLT